MRGTRLLLVGGLLLASCSATLALDLPTEVEFYTNVLQCAEDRAGKDFGEVTEDPNFEGLMSGDSQIPLTGARLHDASAYQACFDEWKPEVPDLAPITGYGDFSDQAYTDIDWFEVTALEVECANDQGARLRVSPPGDGISGLNDRGGHLSEVFTAVFEACRAGLKLPEYKELTDTQLEEHYRFLLEVKQCLVDNNFPASEPPPVDLFIDTYYTTHAWHPYDAAIDGDEIPLSALQAACPDN